MEEQTLNQGVESGSEQPEKGRNVLAIAFGVVAVTACCFVVAAAVLVGMDPFDWNLLARITGRYDAAAEAVPADASMYIGLDLLQLTDPDIERVFRIFAENAPEAGLSSQDDAFQNLDEAMEQEVGITLTDDILPWVGQYVGFGLTDVVLDDFGQVESVQGIFAASVRDRAAAEAFAATLQQQIETDSGTPMSLTTYEDADIFATTDTAFALYRNLFLLGSSVESVQTAIDARKGESFMDSDNFKVVKEELPSGALLTLYFTSELVEGFSDELETGLASSASLTNINLLDAGALSLSFVPEGFRMDTVVRYDAENLSAPQQELLSSYVAENSMEERLPAETLVYISGRRLDLSWQLLREQLQAAGTEEDMDEAMASFAEEFGFNPDTDLFANLDGEYAIVLLPSAEGMLAAEGIDLGLAMLFETSNAAGLEPVISALNELIQNEFGMLPSTVDAAGFAVQQVADPFFGEVVAYGLTDDMLMLATSAGLLGDILGEAPSLASDADYQAIWEPFPDGMHPVIYIDFPGVLGSIREGMDSEARADFDEEIGTVLSPIQAFGMANQVRGNLQFATAILIIGEPGE